MKKRIVGDGARLEIAAITPRKGPFVDRFILKRDFYRIKCFFVFVSLTEIIAMHPLLGHLILSIIIY